MHSVSKMKLRHKIGAVVQLVRIHACHAWGRGFESRPHRKKKQKCFFFCYEIAADKEKSRFTSMKRLFFWYVSDYNAFSVANRYS